eukprot:4364268-Prymnesium_polylepis.1
MPVTRERRRCAWHVHGSAPSLGHVPGDSSRGVRENFEGKTYRRKRNQHIRLGAAAWGNTRTLWALWPPRVAANEHWLTQKKKNTIRTDRPTPGILALF